MPVTGDLAIANVPNILLDRILTAVVFCLIIHYGLCYVLHIFFDLYRTIFYFDLPQIGLWTLLKHPFRFVFTTVFSVGWIYLCVALGILTWLNYRRLHWVKSCDKKKDWKVTWTNFSYCLSHLFIGILLAATYLRFMSRKNYLHISAFATGEQAEKVEGVDERYSFVLLSCGVVSLYFYLNFVSTVDYIMKFPSIETSALLRLRSIVVPTLKESAYLSFHVFILSYLVYTLVGDVFHGGVCLITTASFSDSGKRQLSSITDYFDAELLFVVLMCQLLVTFTMKSLWLTMESLVTKRVHFRIADDAVGSNTVGLREMMVSSNIYLKKLAYFDLKLLTEYDEQRMLALFTLSHPGGFPKIWSNIRTSCLEQITKLTESLRAYIDSADIDRRKREAATMENIGQSMCGPRAHFVASSNDVNPKFQHRGLMRNLHSQNGDATKPIGISGSVCSEFFDNPFAPVAKLLKFSFELVSRYCLQLLSVLNLLKYVKKDNTEAHVATLFADQEMCLWSISSLADVVIASAKIDSKGVVQADICQILTSMVELCSALDDFLALKIGSQAENLPSNVRVLVPAPNSNVKILIQEFKKPLKNEIMRIHLKFHHFYDIINLSPSCEQKLRRLVYHD